MLHVPATLPHLRLLIKRIFWSSEICVVFRFYSDRLPAFIQFASYRTVSFQRLCLFGNSYLGDGSHLVDCDDGKWMDLALEYRQRWDQGLLELKPSLPKAANWTVNNSKKSDWSHRVMTKLLLRPSAMQFAPQRTFSGILFGARRG
jgi:hypothetical protein